MPFCMFPFCDENENIVGYGYDEYGDCDNQEQQNMLDALSCCFEEETTRSVSVEDFFVGRGESPQGKAFALATKFAQIRAAAACQSRRLES